MNHIITNLIQDILHYRDTSIGSVVYFYDINDEQNRRGKVIQRLHYDVLLVSTDKYPVYVDIKDLISEHQYLLSRL